MGAVNLVLGGLRPRPARARKLSRPHRPGLYCRRLAARRRCRHCVAPHRVLGRRRTHRLLRAHCRHPDERRRGARQLHRLRCLQHQRRNARDRDFRPDRLRRQRQHRSLPGRTPHALRPTDLRGLCAAFRRRAFFLPEPHRPADSDMAAALAGVLGLRDRRRPHRGRHRDPDRRAGPARRHPADDHVRVLHPTGAHPNAARRSRQPLQLDREPTEPRFGRRRLGRRGLAGAAAA